MNPGNHHQRHGQQIRKLFDDCLNLTESEQIKHLAQSQAPKSVKNHVAKLLKITGSEIELTQRVIDTVKISLDVKPITAGMKIGSYQLIRSIGEGGQAEVWLAERADGGFDHQVAIKFLKPIHDQKDLVRFHSEREVLATLKHPNIAHLLDGGELGENRPYMVLEYVEGLPLLDYGLLKKFTLNQYLDCFRQICDAVSFAHSHSIIHRDIKPSNIFVTFDGVVKLLDFGIAKFMGNEKFGNQTFPIMTLAYSSPEQVTGQAISTATDVYALGLLLYEMLTGVRAQAVDNNIPAEIIKEITDITPLLPSLVVKETRLNRSYNSRNLQGDLDNLILMTIRKEPARRYGSVDALANDVKNFQQGKPLLAAGDSWLYLTQKFINRNPIVTLTSLALFAFMVAVPIIQFQNQQQIELERDKAVFASKLAAEQKVIAQKTTDFLVKILQSASTLSHQGESIRLKDVLARAENQLTNGLDDQPKIKANLMMKIGGIHFHIGNYEQAKDYYQQALKLFELIGDNSGRVESLDSLAVIAYSEQDINKAQGYEAKAEKLSNFLTDPVEKGWHQLRLVKINLHKEKKETVIKKLIDTVQLLKNHKVQDHRLLAALFYELSKSSNSHALALAYIEKSLYHTAQDDGKVTPSYYDRLMEKAERLVRDKRKQEAVIVLDEASGLAKILFSKDHPKYGVLMTKIAALEQVTIMDKEDDEN
ncbi:MAG: serine/threonine-protein kinase [Marinicella sp.]